MRTGADKDKNDKGRNDRDRNEKKRRDMSVQIPDYTNPYLRTASSGSSGPGALGDNTPAKASNDSDKDTEGNRWNFWEQ